MNDANRNTALPDENQMTVSPEPQFNGSSSGDAPYIAPANLSDAMETAGAVGKPVVATSDLTATGSYETNPEGLSIPVGSTGPDKGGQWERPQPHDYNSLEAKRINQ